jgi:transcriptional regulator with XRE-family HTH domain
MPGNNPIDHVVGSRLALARIVRGWTCGQLARRAGVDPDMLRIIEGGNARAGARRLFDLARVLGVPVRWFFETAGRQTS